MSRFKVLKGVAHNIGHSFTSLMNYAVDDYTMGHILRLARETGNRKLTIDFMTGDGEPPALLQAPIAEIPSWYTKSFWNMVERAGSSRDLVQSAGLTLIYNLERTAVLPFTRVLVTDYTCDVFILDARGKTYSAHFAGGWYEERTPQTRSLSHWLKVRSWLRKLKGRST